MSAYAQLLNIDLNVSENLSAFVVHCVASADEQSAATKKNLGEELKLYIEARQTKEFIAKIFSDLDSILSNCNEEGI